LGYLYFDTINNFFEFLIDDLLKHLRPFHDVDHKNEVPSFAPLFKSHYRLNKKELQEFKAQINNLMERGYIKPNKSPYGLLILCVDQKDKKLRLCIDYCTLNKIIIKNNFLLPQIDDLFYHLNWACYLIHIDMKSGYYQIRMGEVDVKKTTMRTIYGSYKFLVMLFGLCHAPFIFNTLMNFYLS
jgi:hypothetical protein